MASFARPPAVDVNGFSKAKAAAPQANTLRDRLLAWVESGNGTIAGWQAFFGVRDGKPTNRFWHTLFHIGATFGNEIFFITFIPFLFWGWNMTVARRLVFMWVMSYYTGQYLKDTLQLPRPRDPRVARLESHYEHEYGMPSTHAMNALAMPALLLITSMGRYTGSWLVLGTFCACWFLSCTFSRLYLGVHSPADIWTGLAHGVLMLGVSLWYGEAIDHFVLDTPYLWAIALVLVIIAALAYPRPETPTWVSTPGDTVLICASAAGIAIASNFAAEAHHASATITFEGPDLHTPALAAQLVAKLGLGFVVLLGTRTVAKGVCMAVLPGMVSPMYGPADDASIQIGKKAVAEEAQSVPAKTGAEAGSSAAGASLLHADAGDKAALTPEEAERLAGAAAAALDNDVAGSASGLRKRAAVEPVAALPAPTARALSARAVSGGADGASSSPSHGVSPSLRGSAGSPPLDSSMPGPGRIPIPPARRYAVELPTKVVTYLLVGFNAAYTIPVLFQYLGLGQYGIPTDGWQRLVAWWM